MYLPYNHKTAFLLSKNQKLKVKAKYKIKDTDTNIDNKSD